MLISVLCLLLGWLGAVAYGHCKVRYLISKVEGAKSPAEEIEAFRLVNEWTDNSPPMLIGDYGYSVRLFDEEGEPVTIRDVGDYEEVRYVEIEWPSGQRVRRRLIKRGNLGQLMGE